MNQKAQFFIQPLQNSIPKCGCYVKSTEILKLFPNKSVLVPLISSQYHLSIFNAVANIELKQVYKNPTQKFIEIEYSFPVNPNACIYRFIATFGNKRIEGIVKEKEEAKAEYLTSVQEGKQAAYGQLNAENKDILNLKIGNIQPNESVCIQIEYLQQLTLSHNTFYRLQILGTISPRYMNKIFEQSKTNNFPNVQSQLKGQFQWTFKITLKAKQRISFYKSNSHQLSLLFKNQMETQFLLAMSNQSIPNKDFTFLYTTQNYELPTSVYGENDIGSTAIVSFIPKFCSINTDDAYRQFLKEIPYENQIDSARGQYIFLIDRSGSMQGQRIKKAVEALILFIRSLPINVYFNVISFGTNFQSLFKESVRYNNNDINFAIQQIKTMKADMGGTQIYHLLKIILEGKVIEGHPKQIFLLTDGGVSDTQGVIKMVKNNTKYSRVHTIGIGNGCSQRLILGCAQSGKGYSVFINDKENPSEKIIQLLTDSLSPVISRMKLSYDKNIIQSIIPNPESLPYILKNQIANFCISFKGKLQHSTKITLSYENSHNNLTYESSIDLDPTSQNFPPADRMSKFKKIRLLEESLKDGSNLQDYIYFVKTIDRKAQIIKQSIQNQILSEFTAFICVQSQLVDGKYQQITSKGKQSIKIQNIKSQEYEQNQEHLNYTTIDVWSSIPPPPPPPLAQISSSFGIIPPPPPPIISYPHSSSLPLPPPPPPPISQYQLILPPPLPQPLPLQSLSLPPPPPPPPTLSSQKLSKQSPIIPFIMCSSPPMMQKPSLSMVMPIQLPPLPMLSTPMSYSIQNNVPSDQSSNSYSLGSLPPSVSGYQFSRSQLLAEINNPQQMNRLKKTQTSQKNQSNIQSKKEKDNISFMDHLKSKITQRFAPLKRQFSQDQNQNQQFQPLELNTVYNYTQQTAKKGKQLPMLAMKIDDIIALQSAEGCWKDISIISEIYSPQVEQKVALFKHQAAALTFLVIKWIERNHPVVLYKLIIKKGLNFIKKQSNLQEIQAQFSQFTQ